MRDDLIRYDVLAQEALRGVVRKVLTEAARAGLPGEHHFYVSFDTRAPGVRVSSRLREKYPEEMTVVLQHQFWDFSANETAFEVGLAFGGVPERLFVPYTAIKGFFDPSVEFGLQFEVDLPNEAAADTSPLSPVPPPAANIADSEPAKAEPEEPKKAPDAPAAAVVSLDAFRKKN
jgi:hypothetical protein